MLGRKINNEVFVELMFGGEEKHWAIGVGIAWNVGFKNYTTRR